MEEHMSKKTDWGKVVRDTVNDVICAIKNSPKLPSTPNPRARICVLVLMIRRPPRSTQSRSSAASVCIRDSIKRC